MAAVQWPPNEDFAQMITSLNKTSINFDIASQDINSEEDASIKRAAHCLIFARTKKTLGFGTWDEDVPLKALVMMQLRFDGKLGFPGGYVDPGESIVDGANRELKEEICLDLTRYAMTREDLVSMQVMNKGVYKYHLYTFMKEVDEKCFLQIEEESRKAEHFGSESLGLIRAPLHNWREVEGFPRFLTHAFAGTSKEQLLLAIYKSGLMTQEEILKGYGIYH